MEIVLDIKVFVLDVKGDFSIIDVMKDVCVLENVKVNFYYFEILFVVIELFDEEDEKFLFLVFLDKVLVVVREGFGKVLGFLLLYIKFFLNNLMEEFIVEV